MGPRKSQRILDQRRPISKSKYRLPPTMRERLGRSCKVPNPENGIGRGHGRIQKMTPSQLNLLKSKFLLNPNPRPSAFLEMSALLGLPIVELRKWFRKERQRVSISIPLTTSAQPQSNITFDIQTPVATSVAYVGEIKKGLMIIKDYPVDDFAQVLNGAWEVKASRLFQLGSRDDLRMKLTLYRESKRIQYITSGSDLLSEEQRDAVENWKQGFVCKVLQIGEGELPSTESLQTAHIVQEVVIPWLGPFLYSRIVKRNGQNLNLLEALRDIGRLKSFGVPRMPDFLSWKIPGLLQREMPSKIPTNLPEEFRYMFLCGLVDASVLKKIKI